MPENDTSTGRLDSWKDIASYLGRDVRTVIRWEENGLPVHRVPGGKRQAVFAYRAEIDAWLLGKGNDGVVAAPEVTAAISPEFAPPVSTASVLGTRSIYKGRLLKYSGLAAVGMALLLGAVFAVVLFPKAGSPIRITKITRLSRDDLFKEKIATDGANLYFSEYADGKLQLSWMRVDGGPISHISTPFPQALLEDIYADGGELLVRGRDGTEEEAALWIVPADGRPLRRVGDILCHSATQSRDGRAIAYSRGNSIFLTVDEGTTSRELHQFESDPRYVHWSRFGNRLLVVLRDFVTGELIPWEIGFGDHFDVRTISRIPLAPGNCCVGWVDTPDYEFVTREARDENRIWAIPRRRHWWQPTSASGLELPTPLGVVSSLASDLRTARLFVVGGGPNRGEFVRFEPFSRTFSPFLPGVSGNHLDFSRDGKWIAYTAVDERAVLVSRANGKEGRQLTFSFDQVELPRWSPDGTKIAFMGRNIGWPWRIYVVPSEGGTPREASVGRDNQGAPTWSPDGKWLAYANVLCQESHTCSVHRIELATGKIETLPGSAGLQTARWSPDGRYIAALRPEQHQLLVFDTEKQNWTKLADSIVGADLNWSRDSRYLYSNRPVGYKPEILRIPVNGGNPENVVNLESLGKLTGRFSDGLSIAPDNSVILIREINASEIYALDFALTGR